MEFKCHLHFSFLHDIEKQIWILLFVFRFHLTLKNGFELRISFFVFASLWKTDMNFVFRFCITLKNGFEFRFSFSHHFEKRIWISFFVFRFRITLKNGFEFRFSFLHCLLLKNRLEFRLSFLHEFEKWINTPVIWNSAPLSPLRGWPGVMRGLSLHNHSVGGGYARNPGLCLPDRGISRTVTLW